MAAASPLGATACADLARIVLGEHTRITLARTYVAGEAIVQDAWLGRPPTLVAAPIAMCRVAGIIRPSAVSNVKFELWLPLTAWTGRFVQVGNGGFAGTIPFTRMEEMVASRNAVAATDDGTGTPDGGGADAFRGGSEIVRDWGHRAVHVTAIAAKAITQRFYGISPHHSYFTGCSKGGQEGMAEAQRYPDDFDGVLAGAPGVSLTRVLANLLFVTQRLANPARPDTMLLNENLPALAVQVRRQCAGSLAHPDDIFLSDPINCRFDPAVMLCNGARSPSCLTAPQVAALKDVLAGAPDAGGRPRVDAVVPDFLTGWAGTLTLATRTSPPAAAARLGLGYFQNAVDPAITVDNFDIATHAPAAMSRFEADISADDPNLGRFAKRGGRVIMWHGWGDTIASARGSVAYHDRLVTAAGGLANSQRRLRLYLIPGMGHCRGGPGATEFGQEGSASDRQGRTLDAAEATSNMFLALQQWVELGRAPGTLIARGGSGNETFGRPLCVFPRSPKYRGVGNPREARSFNCVLK